MGSNPISSTRFKETYTIFESGRSSKSISATSPLIKLGAAFFIHPGDLLAAVAARLDWTRTTKSGRNNVTSATFRAYWVLIVMDQFTLRIVGFGVQRGIVVMGGLCKMFHRAIRGQTRPNYLENDLSQYLRLLGWNDEIRAMSP